MVRGNGSGGVVYDTTGGDFAEEFPKDNPNENIPYGSIVCMTSNGGVTKCNGQNTQIVGVVSDIAGFVGNGGHEDDTRYITVGLVGQVPIYMSTENGSINPGDPLTISTSIPGAAAKAVVAGSIIGHSEVAYSVQDYSRHEATIQIGFADPTQQLVHLDTNGNLITSSGQTYNPTSDPLFQSALVAATQTALSQATTQANQKITDAVATVSAKLVQDDQNFSDVYNHFAQTDQSIASMSAQISQLAQFNLTSFEGSGSATFQTIQDGLLVEGPTSLADLSVANAITVDQGLTIGANSLNVNGQDLAIQPLQQGNIDFEGQKVTINTNGDLNVSGNAYFAQNVTVGGVLSASTVNTTALSISQNSFTDISDTQSIASESAGTSFITTGQTERTIESNLIHPNSLIYITPVGSNHGNTPYIQNQTEGHVTIGIDVTEQTNTKFNFLIVNVNGNLSDSQASGSGSLNP